MKIKDISGEGLLLDPYMKWEQERRNELITPRIQEERRQGQSEDKEIPWGYQDKVSREKHQPRDLYPHCRKAAGAQQQTRELLLVARACGAEKIKWGRQTPQSWDPSPSQFLHREWGGSKHREQGHEATQVLSFPRDRSHWPSQTYPVHTPGGYTQLLGCIYEQDSVRKHKLLKQFILKCDARYLNIQSQLGGVF